MNILKGEATFSPARPSPLPCGAGSRSNGFSRHVCARELFGAQQNREGKLQVTSSFLESEADMTDISQ